MNDVKVKFAVAAAVGFVGFVTALPWADIVSAQTAGLIAAGGAAVMAVLTALKVVPK